MTAKRDGTHHYFNLCRKDRFSSWGMGRMEPRIDYPKVVPGCAGQCSLRHMWPQFTRFSSKNES